MAKDEYDYDEDDDEDYDLDDDEDEAEEEEIEKPKPKPKKPESKKPEPKKKQKEAEETVEEQPEETRPPLPPWRLVPGGSFMNNYTGEFLDERGALLRILNLLEIAYIGEQQQSK